MSTTFDLSTLGLSAGTHSITVKARASGYEDSDESNAVSYQVQPPIEETYTLSGTWVFGETIDVSGLENISPIGIEFISNGYFYNQIHSITGRTMYYYSNEGDISVYLYDDVWLDTKYRTITILGEQIVDKNQYDWFTANAAEVTVGTKSLTLNYSQEIGEHVVYYIDRFVELDENGYCINYDGECHDMTLNGIKDFVLFNHYHGGATSLKNYKNCSADYAVADIIVYNIQDGATVTIHGKP